MLSKERGICFLAFHLNSPTSRGQPSVVTFLRFQLLPQQLYSIHLFLRVLKRYLNSKQPTFLLQFQVVSPQAGSARFCFGQDIALL